VATINGRVHFVAFPVIEHVDLKSIFKQSRTRRYLVDYSFKKKTGVTGDGRDGEFDNGGYVHC